MWRLCWHALAGIDHGQIAGGAPGTRGRDSRGRDNATDLGRGIIDGARRIGWLGNNHGFGSLLLGSACEEGPPNSRKIAGYKVPKSVEFRDVPLPLSGAMKVLKRELRENYWKGQDKCIG